MKNWFRVLILTLSVLISFSNLQGQVTSEDLKKLEDTKAAGGLYYAHRLSIHKLLWESNDSNTIDRIAADYYHRFIQATRDKNLIPIGTTSTWVFPRFANSASWPPTERQTQLMAPTPLSTFSCVPPIGGPEYQRLSEIRNQIYATLAKEFPDMGIWLVMSEPNWEFYDCSGQRLGLQDQVVFIADTLRGVKAAIQAANPTAIVVAHFLGAPDIPLRIREGHVQPRELVSLVLRRNPTTWTYHQRLLR